MESPLTTPDFHPCVCAQYGCTLLSWYAPESCTPVVCQNKVHQPPPSQPLLEHGQMMGLKDPPQTLLLAPSRKNAVE